MQRGGGMPELAERIEPFKPQPSALAWLSALGFSLDTMHSRFATEVTKGPAGD